MPCMLFFARPMGIQQRVFDVRVNGRDALKKMDIIRKDGVFHY